MISDRVTDILKMRRDWIERDKEGLWLRATATKTDTEGRVKIEGDLALLLDELVKRPRKAVGAWLVQTKDSA